MAKTELIGEQMPDFEACVRIGELGANGKLVADQLGDCLDVSQIACAQLPVEYRLPAINRFRLAVPLGDVIWSTNGIEIEAGICEL
jgi:hypothetical protein